MTMLVDLADLQVRHFGATRARGTEGRIRCKGYGSRIPEGLDTPRVYRIKSLSTVST
jgi:hypothetical protein